MKTRSKANLETIPEAKSVFAPMPVGAWISLDVPDQFTFIGFTYVDPTAGFSARGWKGSGSGLDQSSSMTLRLPMAHCPWRRLKPEELSKLGLEPRPAWLEFYGPQIETGDLSGGWREDRRLKGRFLSDYPDDLQVIIHDGGPRLTKAGLEVVWVRVLAMDGDVFQGMCLNQPNNLKTVRQNDLIKFVVADGADYPVMVTDKYLSEREKWKIYPCSQCGFTELFDAPSDLLRAVFPDADGEGELFTAFCPLCHGVQGVVLKTTTPAEQKSITPAEVSEHVKLIKQKTDVLRALQQELAPLKRRRKQVAFFSMIGCAAVTGAPTFIVYSKAGLFATLVGVGAGYLAARLYFFFNAAQRGFTDRLQREELLLNEIAAIRREAEPEAG